MSDLLNNLKHKHSWRDRKLPKQFVQPFVVFPSVFSRDAGPRSFKESIYQKKYLLSRIGKSAPVPIINETGISDLLKKHELVVIQSKRSMNVGKVKKSLKRARDNDGEAELSSDESVKIINEVTDFVDFDEDGDGDGDGTHILPYIDTLPAALRDRERELHVHHSEVPEAWGALFAAITEGSLPRVMRLWDRSVLRRATLLHKSAVCHPLLVAVHRFWLDLVAFFVAVGCNPSQKGCVHPYSGDLMSSELAQHENSPADLRRLMQDLQFSDSDCNGRKVEFVALRAMALFLGPNRRKARKAALKHMRWLRRKFEEGIVPPKQPWPPLDAKTNGEYARTASELVAVRKKICAITRSEVGYPGGKLPQFNRSKQPYWEEEGGDLYKRSADPLETALVVPQRRVVSSTKTTNEAKTAVETVKQKEKTPITSLSCLRVPDIIEAEVNIEVVNESLEGSNQIAPLHPPQLPDENSVWIEDGLFYHPQEIPRALQPLIYQGIHLVRSKPSEKDDISVTVRMLYAFLIGRPVCSDGEISTQGVQFMSTQTTDTQASGMTEPFTGVILGTKENLEKVVSDLNLGSDIAKKQIALFLSQPGDSQNHPLLHAVHNQRPALVRLFLMIGLDPLQAGTVHPYSGDGLRTDEVSAISPLLLSQKMRTMSSLSSRQRRLVAADAVTVIEEHLAARYNQEAEDAATQKFDQETITQKIGQETTITGDIQVLAVNTLPIIVAKEIATIETTNPLVYKSTDSQNVVDTGPSRHSSRKLLKPKRAELRASVWRERADLQKEPNLVDKESEEIMVKEVESPLLKTKPQARPIKKRKEKDSDDDTDDDDNDEDFGAPKDARENRGRRAKTIAMNVIGVDVPSIEQNDSDNSNNTDDDDDDDEANDDDDDSDEHEERSSVILNELRSEARSDKYERTMQRKEAHAKRLYREDGATDTLREQTLEKSTRKDHERKNSARDVSIIGRWEGFALSKGGVDAHPDLAIDLCETESDEDAVRSLSDIDSDIAEDESGAKDHVQILKIVRFGPSVRRSPGRKKPSQALSTKQTQSRSSPTPKILVSSSRDRFKARFDVLSRSRQSSHPSRTEKAHLPSRPLQLSFALKDDAVTGVVGVLQRYRDIIPDGYFAAPGALGPSVLDSTRASKPGSFFVRFSDLQRELAEWDRLHREVVGLQKLQRLLQSGAKRSLDGYISSLAKKVLGREEHHVVADSAQYVESISDVSRTQYADSEAHVREIEDTSMESTASAREGGAVQLLNEDMKLATSVRNDIAIAATELDPHDRDALIAAKTIVFPMNSSQLSFFPRPAPNSWSSPEFVPPSDGGVKVHLLPPWNIGFGTQVNTFPLWSFDVSSTPESIALEEALSSVEYASNKALAVRAIFKHLVPHYMMVIERAEVQGNTALLYLKKKRPGGTDDHIEGPRHKTMLHDAEHSARSSLTYLLRSLQGIDRMVSRFIDRIVTAETSNDAVDITDTDNTADTAEDIAQTQSILRAVLLSLLQTLSIVITDDNVILDDDDDDDDEEDTMNCVSDVSRLGLTEFRVAAYRIRPLAVLAVLPVEPHVFVGEFRDSANVQDAIMSWTLESRSLMWTYALKWTKSVYAVNSSAISECTALRRTVVQQLVQVAVDFPSSLELPREKFAEINAARVPSCKLWAPILYSWAEFFDTFPTAFDAWNNVLDNLQRGVSTYLGAFLDDKSMNFNSHSVEQSSSNEDSTQSLVQLIEKKEIASAIGWQLVLSLASPLSSFKPCVRTLEGASGLTGWECSLASDVDNNNTSFFLRSMPHHIALIASTRPNAQISIADNPLSGTILHHLLSSAPSGSLESVNMNTAALLVRARRLGQYTSQRSSREISGTNRRRITKLLKRIHGGFRSVIRRDTGDFKSVSELSSSVVQLRLHILSLIRERAATLHAWFTSGGSRCAIPPTMALRFSLLVLNISADAVAISVPPMHQFIGEHPDTLKKNILPVINTTSQGLTISRDGSIQKQTPEGTPLTNQSPIDIGVPIAQMWSHSKTVHLKMRLEAQEQSSIGTILSGNSDDEVFFPALQLPSWLLASACDGKATLSDLQRAAQSWSQWIDQSSTISSRFESHGGGPTWDVLQHASCESVHACIGALLLLSHSHLLAEQRENNPSTVFCAPQTGLSAVKSALKMRPLTSLTRNAIVRSCAFPSTLSEAVGASKTKRTFVSVPTQESKGMFMKRLLSHASLHLRLCCGLFQAMLVQVPKSPEWQARPGDSSLPPEPKSFFSSMPSLPNGAIDISASDACARGILVEALWSMFRNLSNKAHAGKPIPLSSLPLSKVFLTEILSIAAATAFDLKVIDLLQNPMSATTNTTFVSSQPVSQSTSLSAPQVYTQMGFTGKVLVKPTSTFPSAVPAPSARALPDDPHGPEYSRALYSHTSAWNNQEISHVSSKLKSLRLEHMTVVQRIGDALFDVILRESISSTRSSTECFWKLVASLETELIYYDSTGARITLKIRNVFGDLFDLLTRSISSASSSLEGSRHTDSISFAIISLVRAISAPFSAFRVNTGSSSLDLAQKIDFIDTSLKLKQEKRQMAIADGSIIDEEDEGLGDALDAIEGKKLAASEFIEIVLKERTLLYHSIKSANSALDHTWSQNTIQHCPLSSLIHMLESVVVASFGKRFSFTNSGSVLVLDYEPKTQDLLLRIGITNVSYVADVNSSIAYLPYEDFSLLKFSSSDANIVGKGIISAASLSLALLGRLWALSISQNEGTGFEGFFVRYRPPGTSGICDTTDHGTLWKERDVTNWPSDSTRILVRHIWPSLLSTFLQYFSRDPLHSFRSIHPHTNVIWNLLSDFNDTTARRFWAPVLKTWRFAMSGRNCRAVIGAIACYISAQMEDISETRKKTILTARNNLEDALTWLWARESIVQEGREKTSSTASSTAIFRSFSDIWGFLQKNDRKHSRYLLSEDSIVARQELSQAIEEHKNTSGIIDANKGTPSSIFFNKTVESMSMIFNS
jgi:hypothetical protein